MVEMASENQETMDNSSLPFPPDADTEFDGSLSNDVSASPLPGGSLRQQTETEADPSHMTSSENESPDGMIMASPAEDKAPVHPPCLVTVPPGSTDQYCHLIEVLTQQQQRCLYLGQQFSHMGEVIETARFESLAEECRIHVEVVKQAQNKGHPLPPYHTEERTFKAYRIVPSLSGSDMMLTIVKGINLPVPTGLSSDDMDTSVRFEFPCPSLEEAQRNQTRSVRSTTCPEFNEHFKLHINCGHRGFQRVIRSKGIRFEVVHKGGPFKTDKVIGSAVMKLDTLERQCESRQLIEVMNRRKATRAHLEVQVKIREPLGGPQHDILTENWLTMDPLSLSSMAIKTHTPQHEPVKPSSSVCSVL
ncbi:hypothetical protein DPEC_G00306630 [Dallia pectoralis]|uniref:Uncharacterized protein n=1 Tax=Dallia pectoralis TaxID=75939 RepID=A0ACC2FEF9_DALPE|nr:hypothetical protein DPEC_G00306630 [Dallia pectoralis]